MIKKAVVTILGIQNPKYNDEGTPQVKDFKHQAKYYFSDDSKTDYYYNTLPLLIDKYSSDYDIIPIYTEDAKIFNKEVLELAGKKCDFNDDISKINEGEYFEIFSKIDSLIDRYDKVIVDLTHGFRHLPILTIINLVIQNFSSINKIEKILFAKEIIKHTPQNEGEYEIVDLKEYLDIANISFVLSGFESNYTVSNHIKTQNKDYQELINMLSEFSKHIMANSLIVLFRGNNSLVERMDNAIDVIKKHPTARPIITKLKNIQNHIQQFIDLKAKEPHIQLFKLAKIVNKKGYYLNAITLLNEAVGWYCAYNLCAYNNTYKNKYKKSLSNGYDTYEVVSQAKEIIKNTSNDKEFRLKKEDTIKQKDIQEIQNQLSHIQNIEKFINKLIREVDKNRNNLAHANSGKKLEDINKILQTLFGRFQTYCIEEDILKKEGIY